MKKYIIYLLMLSSSIPQAFAGHYDISLPIPVNPTNRNPYLQSSANNTIQTNGLHVTYDYFYSNTKIPSPWLLIQNYLCISPTYDDKPITKRMITNKIYKIKNEPYNLQAKKLSLGKIEDTTISFSQQLVIFSQYAIPFLNTNAGMYCEPEMENWNSAINKNDTISLRIQYPVNTIITKEDTKITIKSNYASNYQKEENSILIGNGTINTFLINNLQIKKVIAELLDGSKADITNSFKEENMMEGEYYLIPINTAVLHFEIQ